MAKLLTQKWPKNGQVINSTAYIYIYIYIFFFLLKKETQRFIIDCCKEDALEIHKREEGEFTVLTLVVSPCHYNTLRCVVGAHCLCVKVMFCSHLCEAEEHRSIQHWLCCSISWGRRGRVGSNCASGRRGKVCMLCEDGKAPATDGTCKDRYLQ